MKTYYNIEPDPSIISNYDNTRNQAIKLAQEAGLLENDGITVKNRRVAELSRLLIQKGIVLPVHKKHNSIGWSYILETLSSLNIDIEGISKEDRDDYFPNRLFTWKSCDKLFRYKTKKGNAIFLSSESLQTAFISQKTDEETIAIYKECLKEEQRKLKTTDK